MMEHPSDDLLERYEADANSVENRHELEAHIAVCEKCRDRSARIRRFDAALRSEHTARITDEMRGESAPRERSRTMRVDFEREYAEAEARLSHVIADQGQFIAAAIHRRKAFHTAGVVRFLCRAVNRLCEEDALYAVFIAETALAIATVLPSGIYRPSTLAYLRGLALKELANAQGYRGEYAAAFNALDRAEVAFAEILAPELDLHIVKYVRASLLCKSEHYEEASRLAAECARYFESCDDVRFLNTRLLLGAILIMRKQYEEARSLYTDLLRTAADAALLARIENNLGICEMNLGELPGAAERFGRSLALYRDLGKTTEAIRVRWNLGCLMRASGRYEDAIARLRTCIAEGKACGIYMDAARMLLDLLEVLILTDRTSEAPKECADLVAVFESAGLLVSALTALAYLKEAARHGSITLAKVEHVRTFLRHLDGNPNLLFAAPPEFP